MRRGRSRDAPTPLDKELYAQVKREADQVFQKPGAYKSGWIVKSYKARGGRYRASAGRRKGSEGLSRWFREEWVDLNRPRADGSYEPCGRRSARATKSPGPYPLCRPSKRVSRRTPALAGELSRRRLSRAREAKREHPERRVSFERPRKAPRGSRRARARTRSRPP